MLHRQEFAAQSASEFRKRLRDILNMKSSIILASLAAIAFSVTAHAAEPDVDKGKKVFKKCKACHEVEKEKNKVGPHLINLFGRTAGALDGYKFSKAMKKKGADEGLVGAFEGFDVVYVSRDPSSKADVPGARFLTIGDASRSQKLAFSFFQFGFVFIVVVVVLGQKTKRCILGCQHSIVCR